MSRAGYRLGYACQREAPETRLWRKLDRLTALLNEDGAKPKWMRWRTYERICGSIEDCEAALDRAWLAALSGRYGKLLEGII